MSTVSQSSQPGQRPVFVTGATSGIGLETTRALAGGGFRVFGGVLPGEDPASVEETRGTPVTIDVTDEQSVAAASEEVGKHLDGEPLYGLVNAAGVLGAVGPVESLDIAGARAALDVNVVGMLAATRAFLPSIRAAHGRIVNISSLSGILAAPFLAPYNASKFAVEGLSDSLRRELLPLGVEVVVVQPGVVHTPLWNRAHEIDLAPYRGGPYERGIERVHAKAMKKARGGMPPATVADAILEALRAERPPTRVRVQRKLKSRLRYSLIPLLPDRLVDHFVRREVWGDDEADGA